MRRTTAAVAAGALGLAALGGIGVGAGLMTTAVAESTPSATQTEDGTTDESTDDSTQPSDEDGRLAERTTRITEALADLVTAGTITQEQADAVAETLASSDSLRGPGGHGGHGGLGGFGILTEGLETAASALGITEDELRTQLEAGDTLGEIADNAGVERATFVDAMVTFAQEQLAERVTAGDLTQERADEISADLEDRITESLDRSRPMGGRGGHGPGDGFGDA